MNREYFTRAAGLACIFAVVLPCLILRAAAEQLPLRHYGVSEGLPHIWVRSIFQDSKGYLWFGTAEGVSRFDGYRFTTYGTGDGLGHPFVNWITEDRQGRVWLGTNGGGVSCFIDRAPLAAASIPGAQQAAITSQKFISFKLSDQPGANRVNALIFDADGRLWCATDAGLYRGDATQVPDDDLKFEVVVPHAQVELPMAAFADSRGRLWFGMADSLIEVACDRIITYALGSTSGDIVNSIVEDHQGRLLASNARSLFEFIEPLDAAGRGMWTSVPLDLSQYRRLHCLVIDRAGTIWIGTLEGLIKYKDGKQTAYTTANGLSDNAVVSLDEDREGNLWIGTRRGVLCMHPGGAAVSFGKSDGLPDEGVSLVFEDRAGHVYLSADVGGLSEVADRRVLPIQWSKAPPFNTIAKRIAQDRRGDWWVGTDQGLFRFQGPDLRQGRGRKVTPADGILETAIVSDLYEDPKGNVWFCSYDNILYCLDPAAPKGRLVARRITLDHSSAFGALRIIADRTGALWIGAQSVLGRIIDGRASMLQPTDGLPEADARAFLVDSRGWLWIGLRYKGVSMTRNPAADPIEFVNYSTENGMASNTVWSIAEDDSGRIYFGTGRGLDRLDPSTGRIGHITAGEKLGGELIEHCIKDSRGYIWVATSSGLTRLDPRAERSDGREPPIYLTRLQVAGQELAVPDTGAVRIPPLTLGPSRNNLLIEYVGLDFHGDRELMYQYKLEGVDAGWGPPTDLRSVNYASLAPGSYKFMVRAVNQDGIASPEPAVLEVRILPPIWRRWWFLAMAGAFVGLAAYAAHRYRVARLIELERVRTRIAADLHDDIGSGLSRIAILSDIATHLLRSDYSPLREPLAGIAGTSRELVDSMSDIVWAINPNKDHLRDLTHRMRRFASDVFTARNIAFIFKAQSADQSLKVGADLRRQVFLVFKECVNNVVRHSECGHAEVDLTLRDGRLVLRVADDGKGFDPAAACDGNGLANIRMRARRFGGDVAIASEAGKGTTVVMKAPLSGRVRQA